MKNFFFALMAIAVVTLTSCSSKSRNKMVENITLMEKNGDEYNTQYLDTLNSLYDKFVKDYPKDSLAPKYLLSSGQSEYTRGTQDPKYLDPAIQKLSKILSDYNQAKEAETATFLLGSIYENYKEDTVKARVYYELYLKKYPIGPYAESVKNILDGNLGRKPEDWIRKFEKEGKIDTTQTKVKVN